ncbi:Hypothetical protein PHPALM_4247 [Phytophthora palmivora]|uniref:O-GlcNAc transferase C-terminal domain-containing protein n=1 Tax=Phytophthora palmivora TaxID=4796 RepID=A0A2P4YKD8_9STRA|nr:Hypothetical protein PHPALM_4247 [Phytophthora palmivora]
MVLVNSEDALIPLSCLEFEHYSAAAVSVMQKDGEKLIQLVKEPHLAAANGLTRIVLRTTGFLGLVNQARARLQFLVDINVPVLVYEEYEDAVEQFGPLVGTMDDLLSTILSGDYKSIDIPRGEVKELVEFFSWSAQQLSKWEFANQAAFHATVAAAVFQIQRWSSNERGLSHKGRLVLHAAAQKLTEMGSEFTKELFYALVTMGVFMDELGPFDKSLRFFRYAAQLCDGDKATLELLKFTESVTRKKGLEERMVSPIGSAYESNSATVSRTDLVLRPEDATYLQYTITPPTMFIGYQGIDVLPIQRAVNQLRTAVYPSLSSLFERRNSVRLSGDNHKLRRVGFISTWFRVHSVGKLLLGVVQNLDRTKFCVIIYHCVHFLRESDEITEAFKHTADEFVELPKSQDAAVQMLRKALLDVVVFPELGMDEWTVLLSHHRVAPIQCVFWGHPITTGNPHIDYFISSEHFVSEHFNEPNQNQNIKQLKLSGYRQSSFSEQIVLFRGLSTIFTEPKRLTAESERITRSRLHLPTNRRIYLCPQTLMKLHPAFDEALAGILAHDEKATIVLLASDTQIVWMEQLRRRFRQRFGRVINFVFIRVMKNHRRVLFLPTLPFAEFQALLALTDVVLDPFPFGGGVTTLDALHLGIPVVTFPAAQSVVHLAAGFLRYMNASDCIATSLDDYIQLAIRIAVNHEDIQQRLLSHRNDIYQDISTINDWNIFLDTVTPRTTHQ